VRAGTILGAMSDSPKATVSREGAKAADSTLTERVPGRPRWHGHRYNRASVYWLAETLSVVPRGLRLSVARQVARLALRFLPVERRAIRKTLGLVTGASGGRLDELTAGVFRDFAMCFADLVSTNRQSAARLSRLVGSVTGAEQFERLPGGIVSVTAHVGNWELAGRLLASRMARRTHVVVSPEEAPELGRWVRRDGEGVRFVPRAHPSVGVELLAALRRGEVVALQADRALGTDGDVRIPFFGLPAPFPLGPFLLARAAGVPVVPAFCVLDEGYRYAVTIGTPITVRRGEEEAAVRAWVAILENVVREYPTQWFNFFDAWNPFGEPSSSDAGLRPSAQRR
jgi:lauroyl/myristoyl acyltransferase